MKNLARKSCLVLFSGSLLAQSFACCSMSPIDESVLFGLQTNIVIWNPETKTEHFIRNARFETGAKNFGFIAPTPSQPELEEVSETAFETLEDLKPKKPNRSKYASGADTVASANVAGSVEIIDEQDVAGYRATVLKASDGETLKQWLDENGYHTTESTTEWTQFYIDKNWYLTAFKVINDEFSGAETGVIRMSFQTEKPFNPYYVPEDNNSDQAALRLYFVAPERYKGNIGEDEPWVKAKWNSEIPNDTRSELAEQLKLNIEDIPAKGRVTFFADDSFAESAVKDDLYFSPSPMTMSEKFSEKIPSGYAWLSGILVILGGGWWLTKKKSKSASNTW